jgi:IclR family pca regulon transcriptional regulator
VERPEDRPAEFVEALAKGLAILECFDASHPEMTLSEVARRVGLSPAAARRSLITLSALGYVGQREKRFHLKPRIMALGSAFYFATRVDELLQPDLRDLVERFGDASSVAALDGTDVIYVAHVSVQRARRAAAVVGARYPALATSMGRVLMAGLPDEVLSPLLAKADVPALTSKTCTDPCILREELARVRANGLRHHGRSARLRHHRAGRADPRSAGAHRRRAQYLGLHRGRDPREPCRRPPARPARGGGPYRP